MGIKPDLTDEETDAPRNGREVTVNSSELVGVAVGVITFGQIATFVASRYAAFR